MWQDARGPNRLKHSQDVCAVGYSGLRYPVDTFYFGTFRPGPKDLHPQGHGRRRFQEGRPVVLSRDPGFKHAGMWNFSILEPTMDGLVTRLFRSRSTDAARQHPYAARQHPAKTTSRNRACSNGFAWSRVATIIMSTADTYSDLEPDGTTIQNRRATCPGVRRSKASRPARRAIFSPAGQGPTLPEDKMVAHQSIKRRYSLT